jgi:hypothetical protein
VGTQSTTDISDTISYSKFVKEYLDEATTPVNAKSNENGNYIKVVDNDGDGVAEYILKTEYNMDVIRSIAKNKYTLAVEGTVAANAVVSEDELAAGDVIVYALIDGIYYANQAEVETITIAKKGIDFKAETITDGETTYGQSGIEPTKAADQNTFDSAFTYDNFLFDLTSANTEETYDLYLDNYGYVRAYTENKHTYGIGLLVDAYYYYDSRKNETAQVEMIVTPNTESTDYDVDTSVRGWNAAGFINTDSDGSNGDRATWKRLNAFSDTGAKTASTFKTNVAAYTNNDDTLTLADVTAYTNRTQDTIKQELDLSDVTSLSNRNYTTVTRSDNTAGSTVYATTDTVYYYVSGNTYYTWTGYANAPARLTLNNEDAAYVVATKAKTASYYTANIIVIEAKSVASDLNFVYYANTNGTNGTSYWIYSVALNDDGDVDTETYVDTTGILKAAPDFYTVKNDRDNTITAVTDYTGNGIYAGKATVGQDVSSRDYVEVKIEGTGATESFRIGTGYTPVYKLTSVSSKAYVAYGIEECDAVLQGQRLIFVKSGNTVLYAINVDESLDRNDIPFTALTDLYNTIKTDNTPAGTYTVTINGVAIATNVAKGTKVTLTKPSTVANKSTGFLGSDGRYYAYGSTLTVSDNLNLTSGYVAWTVKGATSDEDVVTAVAYAQSAAKINTTVSVTGAHVYFYKNANTNGFKKVDDTLWPDADTTFIDGLYEVKVTLNAADSATIKSGSGTVYDANGEVTTTLTKGDTVYVTKDTVIEVLKGGEVDSTYTITADTELDPAQA